jgi:hypothetical protein
MKVMEDNQQHQQPQLMSTFGIPQQTNYRNESLADKVPNSFEVKDGHAFTFKQMTS